MLAKVKQFATIIAPNDPLQTLALLARVFVIRNVAETDFNIYTEAEAENGYIAEGETLPIDFDEDYAVIAHLNSNEGLDSVAFETEEENAYYTVDDTSKPGTLIVTVTSEDQLTSLTYRITKKDIGALVVPVLHSGKSLISNGTVLVEKEDTVFMPATRTGDAVSLEVGIIETEVTFATTPGSDWDLNPNAVIDYTADSIQVISDHPSAGANSFSVDEAKVLDTGKEYLKLVKGAAIIYYEELLLAPDSLKDLVQDMLDNQYIEILFDKYAVVLDNGLLSDEKIDILRIDNEIDLLAYFDTNSIEYADISDRYTELMDATETSRINEDSFLRGSNNTNDEGFTEAEADDIGAIIADMLHEVVEQIFIPDTTDFKFPQAEKWLNYVATRDEDVLSDPNLEDSVRATVRSETYADYLLEIGNADFLLEYFTPKQYDFIIDRIAYIHEITTNGLNIYSYQTSELQMAQSLNGLRLIKDVWYGNSAAQSVQDLELNINTFFSVLDKLLKTDDTASIVF